MYLPVWDGVTCVGEKKCVNLSALHVLSATPSMVPLRRPLVGLSKEEISKGAVIVVSGSKLVDAAGKLNSKMVKSCRLDALLPEKSAAARLECHYDALWASVKGNLSIFHFFYQTASV